MKISGISVTAMLLAFSLTVSGQTIKSADFESEALQRGRSFFAGGDYAAAVQYLETWNASRKPQRVIDIADEEMEYMLAVSKAELNPAEGGDRLKDFLEKYPRSVWGNRVRALIGISCACSGEYEEAMVWFDTCEPGKLPMEDCRLLTLCEAVSCIKTGDTERGLTLLKVVDNLGGYSEDVAFYRACADYYDGRIEDAGKGFSVRYENSLYADWSDLYLAEIALRKGDAVKAGDMAADILARDADASVQVEAERVSGESFYSRGMWSRADEMLTSYVLGDTEPERLDIYQLGMSNWQLGNHQRAVEFLSEVTDGNDVIEQSAWLHKGLSYLELGSRNDALLAFEHAASMNADSKLSERALYNYAMCLQETGRSSFSEPVTAFEKFLNEYPESEYAPAVSGRLVDVYMNSGNCDAALASIEKIRKPDRRVLQAKQKLLYKKGVELYAGGDFGRVDGYLTQAIGMSDYDRQVAADASFWRGEANFRDGKYTQAIDDYGNYLKWSSDNMLDAMALYGKGYSSYRMADWKSAVDSWSELVSVYGDDVTREVLGDVYTRMGDCCFYGHDYTTAEEYYGKSVDSYWKTGDYSLYRTGLCMGLRKDYSGKVAMMERLCSEYPASVYCPAALYEEGRAFQQLEQTSGSIAAFERLISEYPRNDLARTASAEVALAYYQNDDYEKAIPAYKKVIETYPGSEEAEVAMRDLRSIYVETGKVDAYLKYSESVSGFAPINTDERDSLTYVSAERMFTRGTDGKSSEKAFVNYIAQYPEGRYTVNAHYYLGQIYYDMNEFEKALAEWSYASANENTRFYAEALDKISLLAYRLGDYDRALNAYMRLYDRGGTPERVRNSLLGIVRSAYELESYGIVIDYADRILVSRLDPEQMTEVNFKKAQSLLALKRTDEALDSFREIASDTRSEYGAISSYMVSSILFERNAFEAAQENIQNLISDGTPHTYWLARSFILLSDIYMAQEKNIEAKQYLLSLRQNYRESDDIADMIEERLETLE